MRARSIAIAAALALALTGCGEKEEPEPGSVAPVAAEPAPEFEACAEGESQSPVELERTIRGFVPPLEISYEPAELELEDNGHSLEVPVPPGSSLRIGVDDYELVQFHHHAPAEHTLAGRSYPMELHFVNEGSDGTLAVIGVVVEEGKANPAFEPLAAAAPETDPEGEPVPIGEFDPSALLPERAEVALRWVYDGSLTTPPCTEDVLWTVLSQPIELSAAQIASYEAVHEDNNRPVQPLNGRRPRYAR